VRRNVIRVFLTTFASAVYEYVLVRRLIVRISLATFALTIYIGMLVWRLVVRISLATLTFAINELVSMSIITKKTIQKVAGCKTQYNRKSKHHYE
jgi:hypothetical protein